MPDEEKGGYLTTSFDKINIRNYLLIYNNDLSYSLFIGLINGSVYEYRIAEDMNSLSEQRHWMAHLNTVTAVLYSAEAELIFSCSKDKTTVWHCSETSVKMG